MLIDKPNVRRIKNVSAFLYGNGVHMKDAVNCYVTCRGERYIDEICDSVRYWYKTWDRHCDDKHMAEYYNTRDKRVYWLNGRRCDQKEIALPEAVVPQIGLEGAKETFIEGLYEQLCSATEAALARSIRVL